LILPRDKEFAGIAILIAAAIVVSGLLGFYVESLTITPGSTTTVTSSTQSNVVNLDVVPDYGGSGYDAFVLAANLNGAVPTPGSNTTAPGTNDNNITVSSGTLVTFVLTSIDTAVLQNFSGLVATPFTVYNDTASGVISSQYKVGQSVTTMQMGHTFTISKLGVNVPIPPDTIVSFGLTFSTPGVYMYNCLTPCGPGMGIAGYMNGYIIVK